MEELIERVKASEERKAIWRKDPQSIEWKEASKLNKILTGIPLNSAAKCECIEDLFFLLKRENVKQKIEQKMSKRFILKKGKLIQSADFSNIGEASSDEDMIKALKKSPGLIVHFHSVPDNWKEICGIEETSEEKEEDENSNLYDERKLLLMPFWEFLKEDHKSADFGSLPEESFEIILKEAEEAFNEAQEKDLAGDTDQEEAPKADDEGKEEDSTANIETTFTAETLKKLSVPELRQIILNKNVEIPTNISRKQELIDFIISAL